MRALLLVTLVVTAAACVPGRTMRADDAMERTAAPPSTPTARHEGAVALESEALSLAAAGDLDRAVVTLERALRLAPNDARLWLSLAQVRFDQGEYAKADSMSQRAAQLAGRDLETAQAARRLSSQARRRQ